MVVGVRGISAIVITGGAISCYGSLCIRIKESSFITLISYSHKQKENSMNLLAQLSLKKIQVNTET